MILDLDRARRDATQAAAECDLTLEHRRDIYRRIGRRPDGSLDLRDLTMAEQDAFYCSLVTYTGGLGSFGVGTLPEDAPICRAMQAEFQRVFWGQPA